MENNIRRLRIIALLLFITPALALVGSLLANNYIITFNFKPNYNFDFEKIYSCSKENNYCKMSHKYESWTIKSHLIICFYL